jgi:peroxiredoxin
LTEPTPAARPARRGLVGPFSGRQLFVVGLVVLIAVAVLVVVTRPLGRISTIGPNAPGATFFVIREAPADGLRPGDRAPEFAVPLPDGSTYQLTDIDGRPIRLADLRGKAVWLNFWASWCPPCQSETPVLRDLADRYRDRGLQVVGVSVQESNAADVRAYAERYQLDYTIGTDLAGHIFRLYKLYGLPTQFFITPEGVIRSVVLAPLTEGGATAQIEAILPAPSPAPTPVPSDPGPS